MFAFIYYFWDCFTYSSSTRGWFFLLLWNMQPVVLSLTQLGDHASGYGVHVSISTWEGKIEVWEQRRHLRCTRPKKECTLPVSLAPLFFHIIGIINQLHNRRDTLLMQSRPSGLMAAWLTRDPASICPFDYRLPLHRCKWSLPGGNVQVFIDGFKGTLCLPDLIFLEGNIWRRIIRTRFMTNAAQNKQNRLFSPSTCSYQESKEHNYIFERVFGACRQEEVLFHPNQGFLLCLKAERRLRMCACKSQLLLKETPRG